MHSINSRRIHWRALLGLFLLAHLLFGGCSPQDSPSLSPSSDDRAFQADLQKGVHLAEEGKTDEALSLFQRLAESHPEHPEPYNNLAALYAGQGELEQARDMLEKGLRTDPVYETVYRNLGVIFTEIARTSYNKALQLENHPSAPRLHFLKGTEATPSGAAPVRVAASATPPDASTKKLQPEAVSSEKNPESTRAPEPSPEDPGPELATSEKNTSLTPPSPAEAPKVETPSPAAKESTPKAAIRDVLQKWAKDWSDQDVASYLTHYSSAFDPGAGQSYADWEAERRVRLRSPDWIEIVLEDVQITVVGATEAKVNVLQTYRADHYHDRTHKEFTLVLENGNWRITREVSLGPA